MGRITAYTNRSNFAFPLCQGEIHTKLVQHNLKSFNHKIETAWRVGWEGSSVGEGEMQIEMMTSEGREIYLQLRKKSSETDTHLLDNGTLANVTTKSQDVLHNHNAQHS